MRANLFGTLEMLFVGLGNPGTGYRHNRHNIGFMAVDTLARAFNFPNFKTKFSGEVADGIIAGEKVTLLKPMTFMNESGRSVGEAMRFSKIPVADVTVFHDELDLDAGKLRVKLGGGNAGHNGLRSISALCGNDYRRVRLGIGHPGVKELVHGHVLSDFHPDERPWVRMLCDAIASHAPLLVKGDEAGFASKIAIAMGQA